MQITPIIRAKRIFRGMKNYLPILEQNRDKYVLKYCLEENEEPLGVYINSITNDTSNVLFTTKCVRFELENRNIAIEYNRIQKIEVLGEKTTANTLLVNYVADNCEYKAKLSITGGKGKCRDIYEVLRYVNRVRSDSCSKK